MTQLLSFWKKVDAHSSSSYSQAVPAASGEAVSYAGSYYTPRKTKRLLKRTAAIAALVIAGMVVLGSSYIWIRNIHRAQMGTLVPAAVSTSYSVAAPIASQTLNKTFMFPLKDTQGNAISQFTYTIQNASLQNQIVIQGQKATAVAGTEFLIINCKITNSFTKPFSLNARDYIRLSANNTSDWLAPSMYNDPVDVQAISTSFTRLGFSISSADKDLKLQVGEITGKKQFINLNI